MKANKPIKGSEEPPSSCDSTTALSQTTAGHTQVAQRRSGATRQQNGTMIMLLTTLAGLSTTSLGVLALVWLPLPVLIALAMFLTSSFATISLAVLLIAREIQAVREGRGIGDYLPRSIYNQLTQLTLHEWMQDTSLSIEYRHLLLYFVPGITSERLDTYVDSLAPRHRNNLRRQGLGHVFGESFMRTVMGDERYRAHMLENQPRPTELRLPPSESAATLDTASDLGSTSPDLPYPLESSRGLSIDPIIEELDDEPPASRTITIETDETEDLDAEANVLNDAINSMINTYMNVSVNTAASTFARIVDVVTPYVVGTGLGVSAVAAGIGWLGTWSVHPHSHRALESRYPSSRVLWTSGFIGGLTAGGMLAVRGGVRMMFREARTRKDQDKKEK